MTKRDDSKKPEDDNDSTLGRREFVKASGTAALAASVGPTALAACGDDSTIVPGSSSLKILQWNSFIPRYDSWFDMFAAGWAEMNGVDVTVDHMALGDLGPEVTRQFDAGEGHDLIEFIAPPSSREIDVLDLADVNAEAQSRYGAQVDVCRNSSFNPKTGKSYGFCHGWVPDPGNYRKTLWEGAGFSDGPQSWEDLLAGGRMIKDAGTPLGIGMAQELDSNMATRALLWSFGGKVQDDSANIALDSAETRAALEFMTQLYTDAMDTTVEDIFNWVPASNNQALVAGRVSYILNSISAYRTAQGASPETANDVFFTRALPSTTTTVPGVAGTHVVYVYVIPSWSANPEAAKAFLLDHVGAYSDAVQESELYNMAAFPSTAGDTNIWLGDDPFSSVPPDKLSILSSSTDWTVNLGYPGTANAAAAEAFSASVLPSMFAKVVKGELTADAAIAEAVDALSMIYDRWRGVGLI